VQDFVEKLKRTMEMDLDPARRVFDGLARVVWTPALDEAQAEDAETTKIVDADTGSCC
jgi:hypothetical protein